MDKFGLLGGNLPHSISPDIHAFFGDYQYDLYEAKGGSVADFLKTYPDLKGFNVTIPFKKKLSHVVHEMSSEAELSGSVNVVMRRADGTLFGDNTDKAGFEMMLRHEKLDVNGKKALILGNGGAAGAVRAALEGMGAKTVTISRRGPVTYEQLDEHKDANFVVNTTPLGMFPNVEESAISFDGFTNCEAAIDLIYNPLHTAFLLDAKRHGIRAVNGLYMLVAQAFKSAEIFRETKLPFESLQTAYSTTLRDRTNIILIGMPGSGKSLISDILSEKTGRLNLDTDSSVLVLTGKTAAEIIEKEGEAAFRKTENKAAATLGKRTGLIIATGGGIVTEEENYRPLAQNGIIFHIKRNLEDLPTEGRPLSERIGLEALYEARGPIYEEWADVEVENTDPEKAADEIIEIFEHYCRTGRVTTKLEAKVNI